MTDCYVKTKSPERRNTHLYCPSWEIGWNRLRFLGAVSVTACPSLLFCSLLARCGSCRRLRPLSDESLSHSFRHAVDRDVAWLIAYGARRRLAWVPGPYPLIRSFQVRRYMTEKRHFSSHLSCRDLKVVVFAESHVLLFPQQHYSCCCTATANRESRFLPTAQALRRIEHTTLMLLPI